MKEYPATSRAFKANKKMHKMKKLTLGLQADIEDENISVTYRDVITVCTDMGDEDVRALHDDQLQAIFDDIQLFTYEAGNSDGDESKKP